MSGARNNGSSIRVVKGAQIIGHCDLVQGSQDQENPPTRSFLHLRRVDVGVP